MDIESRRQMAALLDFCRELGCTDFYRDKNDTRPYQPMAFAAPAPAATAAPIAQKTTPKVQELKPAMPRKPVLIYDPPLEIMPMPPVFSPQEKADKLVDIRDDLGDCTRCPLCETRNKIVFGDGDPNAALMFVGEGPGADEDAQGLPFVGRGGQLLNNMISAMGLRRDQVYIANIVKCRPPQNRVPEPIEANTCTPFLFRQIEAVQPRMLVALGATAATYLLGVKTSLSSLRGRIHDCHGAKLIVTYHPAYLLRDPRQKGEAWKDLQLAMQFLGLKSPEKNKS
ncbi:MAG TPA: uracil-DNA glycosylase [Acidobacteriaceae bacterium]|nr:uracil-DNA glycosylase [Acidobacteriaceae bacterium]